jgi:phosphatidylserine/phosphatidylglycerophosphate/cardiolipin synthase-like enzyme
MSVRLDVSQVFLAIALHPDVAAQLCDAVLIERWQGPRDLKFICKAAGIPSTQQSLVEKVLLSGLGAGFCRRVSSLSWEPLLEKEALALLCDMLKGADSYRQNIHRDADIVEVVLTRPPKPSRLEQALQASGYCYLGLGGTSETFEDMASRAVKRFVVMTPFIDREGAVTLLSLFKRVPDAVSRELVLRYKDESAPPPGFLAIAKELSSLGVVCYNYRLERELGEGYETFHAKVVLVDDNWCYVGSANMTWTSFAYSMELGVSVRGSTAGRVGNLIDAIIRISKRVTPGAYS